MSRTRTRHPDESSLHKGAKKNEKGIYEAHVDARGRVYNGRSNKPLKFGDVEKGIEVRSENLHDGSPSEPSEKMLAIVKSGFVMNPRQISWVRQGVANIVQDNLKRAAEVLEGKHIWNSSQTRLFLGLLDKIAPRMSDNVHRQTMQPQSADYSKMSRADLEAALAQVLDETKVIDVTPEAEVAPEPEARRRPTGEAQKALDKRSKQARKRSLAEVRARHAEKEPTVLAPLTREEDERNRRRAKNAALGLKRSTAEAASIKDLEAMASMDPIILGMAADPAQAHKLDPRNVAERFLKTPTVDRPAEPE